MNIFSYLGSWKAKDLSLKVVTLNALKSERLDLENQAQSMGNKLQQLEIQAEHLRESYLAHVNDERKVHQEFVVREYREVQEQIKTLQARHAKILNWQRVTGYLVMIKEDEALLLQRGRSSVLSMNLIDLKAYVESWLAKSSQGNEQLLDLLDTVETEQKRVAVQQDAGQLDARNELDAWVAERSQVSHREIEQALADIDRELIVRQRSNLITALQGGQS